MPKQTTVFAYNICHSKTPLINRFIKKHQESVLDLFGDLVIVVTNLKIFEMKQLAPHIRTFKSVCVCVGERYNITSSHPDLYLPPLESPTPSLCGTMAKEYLWWSTRMRRCMSQLWFLVTCLLLAIMMTMRKRSQVRGAPVTMFVWIRMMNIFVCYLPRWLFVWSQVEEMDMVQNSVTSSAPSSLWRLPVRSTDTVLSRWGHLFS